MARRSSVSDLDELILEYIEETADAGRMAELDEKLRTDPAAARRFVRLAKVHSGLRRVAREETAPSEAPRARGRIVSTRWLLPLSVAACLVLVAGSLLYNYYRSTRLAELVVARILETSPDVRVVRDGTGVAAVVGLDLAPGDLIRTKKGQSLAFRYGEEETRVRVGEKTRLVLRGDNVDKTLHLDEGRIDATVGPQREGHPMTVRTPHITATIEGTRFTVNVGRSMTRLSVDDGRVGVAGGAGTKPVRVDQGQFTVAGSDSVFPPEPLPLKIVPVSEKEKARLLAAETPEQKKLRSELEAMKGTSIFFGSNVHGDRDIFAMDPDGSAVDRLTSGPEGDGHPHLSPDGRRIVFSRSEPVTEDVLHGLPADPEHPLARNRVKPNTWANFVWVMSADGTGARRVAQGTTPRWSPDGKVVAYMIKEHPRRELAALLDLERSTENVLDYEGPQGWDSPCFTPNGKWLVAAGKPHDVSLRLNERGNGLLPAAKPLIALRKNNCSLDLSPDGKWLTWTVDTHGNVGSWIGFAQFDQEAGKTSGPSRDCNLGWDRKSVNYSPDFSPCGRYMAYVHAECVEGIRSWLHRDRQDVYVCRFPPDGVSVRITWTNAACTSPAWEPAPVKMR